MKYIVYLTTNKINNKIYVGVHKTEDPNIFDGYIGNSINIFKANPELKHPKIPFHKAVKKYGYNAFVRSTIQVFDSEEEALNLESLIVDENFIAREDTYNIALGGGLPPLHNKVIYQYSLNGDFIKEWESLVAASKEYNISSNNIGIAATYKRTSANHLWSFIKVDKLNIQEYHIYSAKIPIYLYDINKNYIRSYESMSECFKDLNVNLSTVQRAVKLGNCVNDFYLSTVLYSKFIAPIIPKVTGDIHQYDLDGNYIRSYTNKEELGIFKIGDINRSIKEDRTYKGYIWIRGEKLDKVPPRKVNKIRKIGQYTMDGKLVKIFNTLREARIEFPNVSKVLRGTANHCHNFKFKYLE